MNEPLITERISVPRGAPAPEADDRLGAPVTVDVLVPVYNEERELAAHIRRLRGFLDEEFPFHATVVIVDNASTDRTDEIAHALVSELDGVRLITLDQKGRGRALHAAWLASSASILVYMDVDLSTDLKALLPLVAPLVSGHSQLAIGTRLSRSSQVTRGAKREFISRGYNLLLRGSLGVSFSDAQCGFKAITRQAAVAILPYVEDTQWFFDTELLVIAERAGLRIAEVPVDWSDDPDSTVDIPETAMQDLRGIWRMLRRFATHSIPLQQIREQSGTLRVPHTPPPSTFSQVLRFCLVGVASTIAYALLFLLLRGWLGGQGANFAALLITAVLNTAANRAFTFGVSGMRRMATHQVQGLIVFGIGWAITAGSLSVLHAGWPGASGLTELVVLTAANLLATLVRFVLFRGWVFRRAETSRTVRLDQEGSER